MYSRYSNRSDSGIRLPEHYSGCAFSERATAEPSSHLPHHPDVAKPSPRVSETTHTPIHPVTSKRGDGDTAPPTPTPANPSLQRDAEVTAAPPAQPMATPIPPFDTPAPLPSDPRQGAMLPALLMNGADPDQLLILGLILLLSRNEQSSDIVLWLFLLLLFG